MEIDGFVCFPCERESFVRTPEQKGLINKKEIGKIPLSIEALTIETLLTM